MGTFIPGFWNFGIGSVPLEAFGSSIIPPGFLVAEQIIPMSDGSIPPSSDRDTPWSIKPFATSYETGWSPMIQILVWFLSARAAAILVNW